MCWPLTHQNIIEIARGHISLSRAPRTIREDAKNAFLPNPSPSGFSGFSTTGRSALGLRRCSLLHRTVHSVNLCFAVFLSELTLVLRTDCFKGTNGPRIGVFSKKLLLSGIFYGIPGSRLRIVVDKLMHLRNDQLGKLVSPRGL
jgi:hypothetical protein